MKGITKAIKRTPHLMTTKVGFAKKSQDPEFDDYGRRFSGMEELVEKLLKDCKKFSEAVIGLYSSSVGFSERFANLFHTLSGEYDLIGKNPEAGDTIRNVDLYIVACEELKATISPELELIESRIVAPTKELQGIMKQIRKTITKREHKLLDYDRFNNSLTKLREKKEKTLNDEKNLFKLEQDFELATNEYEYINNAMKEDLPRFMVLAVEFIDPLFHSLFYMQLNIFYLTLEKFTAFADGKYDVSVPAGQIAADYEQKRTDAWEVIENMNITKRIISTSKFVQANRSVSGNTPGSTLSPSTSLNRNVSSSSTPTTSSFVKKPPPSPNSYNSASPPPYSTGATSPSLSSAAAATKRAPPAPPPLKPKPKAEPPVQYVVALYDFTPQADGDLEFSAGDRIEVVERTNSAEDWWTGRLNGRQGVFPGNYVQET